ncbi:MAG: hypothetical protein A2X56_05290 [Nitrospirae bacterium GWC2_57_13]|jgi:DNA-binding beta-propeller fold protein YncE|nr:MAG: hypothetical protein A2X56_05290 [Nitrospirae bacterium GWC2_57_13]OGW45973.1 MAG: hypothetical protein A2X57_11995 [Nitrospirae bacterium GWD2_57_8]HAS55156.1 hypothetical protein [Nitrospiraceae bacterium]
MTRTGSAVKLLGLALVILVGGCASGGPKKYEAVFYPEPPELPRIQFLTSFTEASDVQPGKSWFELFITGEKEARLRPDKPYGTAVHQGRIFVCDTNSTVVFFDLGKKTYGTLEGAVGLGKLRQPLNISIDRDGNKYVADPVRSDIAVYDRNDAFVRSLNAPERWKPVDVAVFEDGVYVVDMKNALVHVFDRRNGAYLRKFGQSETAEGSLRLPANIAFDKDGYLYLSDTGRFQIVKMDRDGNIRGTFGQLGTSTGYFARPRGVAVDRAGRVYAVDAAFDNVQIFTAEKRMLMYFGKAGVKPGDLFLPASVTIDYDNVDYFRKFADPKFEIEHLIFVTSQFGERLVNVYGFGKEKGKTYPTEAELLERLMERMKIEKEKQEKEDGTASGEKK